MCKKVLYTTSYEDIIESIANICDCNETSINNYLKYSRPFRNTFERDIKLNPFFKDIGVQFIGNNELFDIIKFDSCVISHLTTRTSPPNESNIYSLNNVLSKPTDINRFLASKGLTFKKTTQGIVSYYNNKIVDWSSFDSSYASRIKIRLRTYGEHMDNCVNGFLFNHLIWEDSNVEHIKNCPEIITDICHVIHREDIINEWRDVATSYALGFLADVKDIIFDEHTRFKTNRSKIYLIYRYVIYYLVQVYHGLWDPRHDNPIIRLKDNHSVNKDDIVGFYKIEA